MGHDWLIQNIRKLIGLEKEPFESIDYKVLHIEKKVGYEQQLIEYYNDGNRIPAYLLIPECRQHCPAVLLHHQHNGERHLGKSEVCGLAGNPLQAFGPALAQKGFVVLSPDSICFEDRRTGADGIHPLDNDGDFLQHYNGMCYRIIKGDTLQRTVLSDAIHTCIQSCSLSLHPATGIYKFNIFSKVIRLKWMQDGICFSLIFYVILKIMSDEASIKF